MKSFFIGKQINYDGRQLAPHWIYKNFNVIGDAICAFIGASKRRPLPDIYSKFVINIQKKSLL